MLSFKTFFAGSLYYVRYHICLRLSYEASFQYLPVLLKNTFLSIRLLTILYFCRENDGGNCYLENLSSGNNNSSNVGKEAKNGSDSGDANGDHLVKTPMFQRGVLRTNCIDCLDRTNVAQYAYGLVALGRQLHALGFLDSPDIDLDNPLAEDLMGVYETMGDTLALQYGGSAAHNKVP